MLFVPFVVPPLVFFLAAITGLAAVPMTCWDAASEFNDSANPDAANPSGLWSAGWKLNLTGKFFLATTASNDLPHASGWATSSGVPQVAHNTHPVPVTVNTNPIIIPPRALVLHPGPDGSYAVLRFTVPTDGAYKVSGQFYALDDNAAGTTTDVWILPNEDKSKAFSARVDYKAGAKMASFTSRMFQLKKGDTLDFEVGYGGNKNYEYDSTGLAAIIEKVK
ncbi:MAG TPA: hypothetical protein VGG02_07655 [Chthoniobacterales bacterium]